MTENLVESGNTDGVAVSGNESEPVSQSYSPAPEQSSAPVDQGQYFTQSQIDKMIHAAKSQAKSRTEEEVRKQYEQNNAQNTPDSNPQGQNQYLTADEARRIAQEEYQSQVNQQYAASQQEQVSQMVKGVADKILGVQEQYPDIREKLSVVNNFDNAPNSLFMLSELDNAGDVAYELASNPQKLIQLESLAAQYPLAARQQLTDLANSITRNQGAADTKRAPNPLNPIQPSSVNVDNGSFSDADLRSIVRNRGRR